MIKGTRNHTKLDDERNLIEAVFRGEKHSIIKFYDLYKLLIYNQINKYEGVSKNDADDLFQGFFLKLMENNWRILHMWRGESKLSTYLVAVLKFYIADHFRLKSPLVDLEQELDPFFDSVENIEKEMDLSALKHMLTQCVKKLNARDRKIFTYHFVDEQTAESTGALLKITKNATYKAVFETKKRIKNCLEKDFPFLFASRRMGF